jgi:hypothetical protein
MRTVVIICFIFTASLIYAGICQDKETGAYYNCGDTETKNSADKKIGLGLGFPMKTINGSQTVVPYTGNTKSIIIKPSQQTKAKTESPESNLSKMRSKKPLLPKDKETQEIENRLNSMRSYKPLVIQPVQ